MNIILKTYNVRWMDTIVAFLESDQCPSAMYPIVLYEYHDLSRPFILYNPEQLTRSFILQHILTIATHPNCMEVWDYSMINIGIFAKHGVHAIHRPPVLPESLLSTLRIFRQQPIQYDIGFCGYGTPRRRHIIESLIQKGYRILFLSNTFGEERDKKLAACKTLLNIHAGEDYQVFESSRCEPWLAIGVPVISEHSLDNDSRCINVSYEELVSKTIEILQTII